MKIRPKPALNLHQLIKNRSLWVIDERFLMALLALPQDVLRSILQQPSIGACDLCALEGTSKLLRGLVDNTTWERAFLQERLCNALKEPESWKMEYFRREAWSRSWRHVLATSHQSGSSTQSSIQSLRLLSLAQAKANGPPKPRRLGFKKSSAPSSPGRGDTLVVDQRSAQPGIFTSISDALLCCQAYQRVIVRPGRYVERLHITKPVELVGSGSPGSTVLVGVDGPAIETSSRVIARIANMSIKQHRRAGGSSMSGAVLIKGGARVTVEECTISSETGHCVVIQGVDSFGYIIHNVINNGKGVGVLVCESGKGCVEDNDISFNGRAGVAIMSKADPIVCVNRIHEGMDSGVLVSERGRGRIVQNDIYANRRAGVAILKEGAPLVKRNRIHNGRDSGVVVCENGQGSIIDNEIFANHMAGVAIGRGGSSCITGNTIRDCSGGSLCLSQHSHGLISSNVIHQDVRTAMQMPERLLGEVCEHNMIQFTHADVKIAC
tara:strand:- start:2345 stop:3826 length:1482 start_codon:yes stop_codon:yes gene_type:complete